MSTSHFMMVWKVQSWMPEASLPMREGWKKLSGGGEGAAALGEVHVLGEVAAGEVDGVRERVALVDRHGVRDAVAGVEHAAGGAAGGAEREHAA